MQDLARDWNDGSWARLLSPPGISVSFPVKSRAGRRSPYNYRQNRAERSLKKKIKPQIGA